MLYHVMDRDHARMVEPGRGPRLPHRPRQQLGALLRCLRWQGDLLDRHHPVQKLVVTAPNPAHAPLADHSSLQVPARNERPRPTPHGSMIAAKID